MYNSNDCPFLPPPRILTRGLLFGVLSSIVFSLTLFSLNSNLYGDATWTGSEDKVFSNANNWTADPLGANLYIGNDAADLTLGTSMSIGNMYMGNGSTSADSSLTINNGGSLTGTNVYIGQDAKATLTIETGATLTATGGLWTGNNSGSKGVLNISGGNVTVGSGCQIGNNGEGEVNVSGGELIYNGQIRIANQGKTGALNISGGNVSFNQRLYIGQRGEQKGSVTLSENGKMTVDQFLFVGGGSSRTVTLSNGTSLSLSGSNGSGILTLKGNSQLIVNGDTNQGGLYLGECANNSTAYESKLEISGNAVLTVTGKEFMVASGGSTTTSKAKASINQTGGTINVKTDRMLIANATGSSATIDVSGGKLNLLVNARSNDVPLGLPFNVSQYACLCYLLAQVSGLAPGKMTYIMNNAHIYANQVEGIRYQLSRKGFSAPTLWINPDIKDFFKFDNSKDLLDIKLKNYKHSGTIKMPVTR